MVDQTYSADDPSVAAVEYLYEDMLRRYVDIWQGRLYSASDWILLHRRD
jgi:hypothetical protein